MLKTTLVFEDGTVLSSGEDCADAIRAVTLTQAVNSGTELTLGSVCSSMLEAQIIAPGGQLAPQTGTQVRLYRNDALMGVFLLEKPTRMSANLLQLTAYDRVSLLDRDLTQWLEGLAGWPYSLYKFAWMVAAQCGLELENDSIPNGDYPVEKFRAQGVTGRQLMAMAAQAAGRFCHATSEGRLRFDWYTPGELTDAPYENTVRFEDYTVSPIDRVQIGLTADDVGTSYPQTGDNPYRVTGNYLLTGIAGRQEVAQTLYEQLRALCYTPCRVSVPATTEPRAGQILTLVDRNGTQVRFLVMKRTQQGQRDILECTGSPSRGSVSAANHQSFSDINGRVMTLQTQVDGLLAENRLGREQTASLRLDVDAIATQVSRQSEHQESKLTALEQTASGLALSVQSLLTQGVDRVQTATGFTFDANGLRVEKTGSDLTNRIDQEGMRVLRGGGQVMLRADVNGVLARDVTVDNYLCIGDHARFENYAGGRTACYYVGG